MNITLSADEKLIQKSRKYAEDHNTSLNNLIREYLKQLCGEQNVAEAAEEFGNLAKSGSGRSDKDYHFSREVLYDRTDQS